MSLDIRISDLASRVAAEIKSVRAAPPNAHTHTSGDISDSTVTGQAVMTAADAAAARTAIGAGTPMTPTSGATPGYLNAVILGAADPVPAGLPANTAIIRLP